MNPLLFSIIFVMTHTSMNTAPLDRQGNKNSSKRPSILSSITATFPKNNFKSYCPLSVFCEHSSVYHKTNRKTQHLENTGISIVTHNSVFPCRKKPKYKKKNSKTKHCYLNVGWWQCRMYWKKSQHKSSMKDLVLKCTRYLILSQINRKQKLGIPF